MNYLPRLQRDCEYVSPTQMICYGPDPRDIERWRNKAIRREKLVRGILSTLALIAVLAVSITFIALRISYPALTESQLFFKEWKLDIVAAIATFLYVIVHRDNDYYNSKKEEINKL